MCGGVVGDYSSFATAPGMDPQPAIVQTLIFLMTLYPNIRWRQFIRNAEERDKDANDSSQNYSNSVRYWMSYRNFIDTCRPWCVGGCLMSAIALCLALQNAGYLVWAH